MTIAASNSFDDGIHAAGTVTLGGSVELSWELFNAPLSESELEIWYPGADRFTVDLLGPNGAILATVAPGSSQTLTAGGPVAVFLANRLNDPNNGDNMIGIFFGAGMPGGTYRVRLTGDTVSDGRFHAWIERDNLFQSQFSPPHDNRHTIGSVSCGALSLAVGSYDAHKTARPLSFFSSAGPTRDGRQKPEVSAPGHDVLAAQSSTGNGVCLKRGTSMAAPAVAGLIALILAEAHARGLSLPIERIRELVVEAARRNPPTGTTWHDRYGHGRIAANTEIQEVIDQASGPPVPASAAVLGQRKATRSRKKRKPPTT